MKSKDETIEMIDSGAAHAIKPDDAAADLSQGESVSFKVGVPPRSFAEMIGQREVVRWLTALVELARRRGEVLGHALLLGRDGCGKRTTARLLLIPPSPRSTNPFVKQSNADNPNSNRTMETVVGA